MKTRIKCGHDGHHLNEMPQTASYVAKNTKWIVVDRCQECQKYVDWLEKENLRLHVELDRRHKKLDDRGWG